MGGAEVSRDYYAKRLAKELDIPYAEALRRVRAQQATVEPPLDHIEVYGSWCNDDTADLTVWCTRCERHVLDGPETMRWPDLATIVEGHECSPEAAS